MGGADMNGGDRIYREVRRTGDSEFVPGRQLFQVCIESATLAAHASRDEFAESACRVAARRKVREEQRAQERLADELRAGSEQHGGRGRHGRMARNLYSDSLTYEKIFNGDLHPWGNLQAAQSAAASCSYAFLLFEGRLYTTDRHTGAWSLVPAVTRASLAEGEEALVAMRDTVRKRDMKIAEMTRGHERLHTEVRNAIDRANKAEERAERQRAIIDSMRKELPVSTPTDKRYAGA